MKDKAGRNLSFSARRRMGGSTRFKPIHGKRNTVEYRIWQDMHNRCRNPNVKSYQNYGARGIKVCEQWNTFQNFLNDVGHRPSSDHSIDRINNNGDYTRQNVRWIKKDKQQCNKRNNVKIFFEGKVLCVAEIARRIGIKPDTFRHRLRYGWTIEEAIYGKGDNKHDCV